jgi:hypothetical protein
MKLELLTKEEAAARAGEMLSLPMYRPTHRVCNLFDVKNNKLIITEFQDFLSPKKEEFRSMTSRQLAIPTPYDDLIGFLPEEWMKADEAKISAWQASGLYIVKSEGRYFAIGHRFDNHIAMEKRTDGMEFLGEVGAGGEFRFVYIPRVGMCIRPIGQHELNDYGHGSMFGGFMRNPDGRQMNSYSSLIILANDDLTLEFEAFGVDEAELRKYLDIDETLTESMAWRLRNWQYPSTWDIDTPDRFQQMRYRRTGLDRVKRRVINNKPIKDVRLSIGAGEVIVVRDDEPDAHEQCVPGLEYAYAETFYVN